MACNNVLRQWVDDHGIGFYTAASRPTSPLKWPWLGVSIDQGSDGWAATQYALYELKANWERFPDPSHGAGRKCINHLLCIVVYTYIYISIYLYIYIIQNLFIYIHIHTYIHIYIYTYIYIYIYTYICRKRERERERGIRAHIYIYIYIYICI